MLCRLSALLTISLPLSFASILIENSKELHLTRTLPSGTTFKVRVTKVAMEEKGQKRPTPMLEM